MWVARTSGALPRKPGVVRTQGCTPRKGYLALRLACWYFLPSWGRHVSITLLPQVGLGTDVAGGYSASMLDCIRQTVIATNVIGMKPDEDGTTWKPLRCASAFREFVNRPTRAHVFSFFLRLYSAVCTRRVRALGMLHGQGPSKSSHLPTGMQETGGPWCSFRFTRLAASLVRTRRRTLY